MEPKEKGSVSTPPMNPKPETDSTLSTQKSNIVRLAIWGILPASLAEWLITRGGMRHE